MKFQFELVLQADVQVDRRKRAITGSEGPLDRLPQADLTISMQDKNDENDPKDQEVARFVSDQNKSFKHLLENEFASSIRDRLDKNFLAGIIIIAQKKKREQCQHFAYDEGMAVRASCIIIRDTPGQTRARVTRNE
jgi:hypothetical protein